LNWAHLVWKCEIIWDGALVGMWKTNRYKTKIMLFYYIAMRTYVFVFHKYLLTYLFSMYKSYAITILPTMDFTYSQTMPKILKINLSIIFHKCTLWNFQLFTTSYSLQMKVFPKAPNAHLYIKQKKTKLKSSYNFTPRMVSTCTLICEPIFLMTYHFWVMHINVCQKFLNESLCLNHAY
jgi:hypothetical protein